MKQGIRIYDTDTHIDPGADVLEKYVDPAFRPRLDDLAAYRVAVKFGSDYPHHESWFPHSVDKVLEWSSLGAEVKRKLFWENATRCFKQT